MDDDSSKARPDLQLPSLTLGSGAAGGSYADEIPNSIASPHLYSGVTFKRVCAYGIDLIVLSLITLLLWFTVHSLAFLTFGLAGAILLPLMPLVPIAYHTLLIVRPRGQTVGMKIMNIEVRTLRGDLLPVGQVFVMVALFYLTLLFPVILLAVFFNSRRRALHDIFSGTVVINRQHV